MSDVPEWALEAEYEEEARVRAAVPLSNSEYGTSDGVELTDELIERLAREAEEGYDVGLLSYLAERERQRTEAINRALSTLRPYERRLVHEAAVMGYVRGVMVGRSRATLGKPVDGDVPSDASILTEVIGACIAMDYPYLVAASEGRRRRVSKNRRWPGE